MSNKLISVIGIERFENLNMIRDMHRPENTQRQEPDHHYRAKKFPDEAGAELLYHKYDQQDTAGYEDHGSFGIIDFKPFNSRHYSKRRRYYTVSHQCGPSNDRNKVQPSLPEFLDQRIKGQDPSFPLVIGP